MATVQATLPGWIQAGALMLALLLLVWQARPLARYLFDQGGAGSGVLPVLAVALVALRWFNTAPLEGVMLHLTGASIATLLLGAGPALAVMGLASLAGVLMGAAWHGWAVDFLVTGALPVAVTALASRSIRRWLPHHIFVYIMGSGFFAVMLAAALSVLAKSALTALIGGRSAAAYLAATPLLGFAEAFLTGTLITVIVVYRPQWCASFDDKVYLWPQRPM